MQIHLPDEVLVEIGARPPATSTRCEMTGTHGLELSRGANTV